MREATWRGLAILVAVALVVATPGCSRGGIDGEYADEMGVTSYTFKPGGKVILSSLGARMELDYAVDGKDVKILMPGGGAMVLTVLDDGSLGGGPLGMKYRKASGKK